MHSSAVLQRALAGRKPGALPSGFSQKQRQRFRTAKGSEWQRKKLSASALKRKKRVLKEVFVWGFGARMTQIASATERYFLCEKGSIAWPDSESARFSKSNITNEILDCLERIEAYYKRIRPLVQAYRKDPDFKHVFFTGSMLPRIRKAVRNFLSNPSEKNCLKIKAIVYEMGNKGAHWLSLIHKKYGVGDYSGKKI